MKFLVIALLFVSALYVAHAQSYGAPDEVAESQVYDIKTDLLGRLTKLLGQSGGLLAKLTKNGKTLLASSVSRLVNELKKLEERVQNADPRTDVGKMTLKVLGSLVHRAEVTLEELLKKAGGTSDVERASVMESVEGLLKIAQKQREGIKNAVKFLRAQGKSLAAAELELLDTVILGIISKLEKLPKTGVTNIVLRPLENQLTKAGNKLQELLKKFNGHAHL